MYQYSIFQHCQHTRWNNWIFLQGKQNTAAAASCCGDVFPQQRHGLWSELMRRRRNTNKINWGLWCQWKNGKKKRIKYLCEQEYTITSVTFRIRLSRKQQICVFCFLDPARFCFGTVCVTAIRLPGHSDRYVFISTCLKGEKLMLAQSALKLHPITSWPKIWKLHRLKQTNKKRPQFCSHSCC